MSVAPLSKARISPYTQATTTQTATSERHGSSAGARVVRVEGESFTASGTRLSELDCAAACCSAVALFAASLFAAMPSCGPAGSLRTVTALLGSSVALLDVTVATFAGATLADRARGCGMSTKSETCTCCVVGLFGRARRGLY
jgi:hypothetical protein